MSRASYLFTSESVSEGHPDKVCDRISDEVVDAFFEVSPRYGWDPGNVRVACETLATTNRVVIAGETRGPAQITKDYKGQRVHLIGVLKGAAIFLSDLVRHVHVEVSLDFMSVSSYGHGSQTSGQVRLNKDLDTSIEGLNVILVEDILDTGLTVAYLRRVLLQRKPRVLRVAALLEKPGRHARNVRADYVGFRIPGDFVVGYGLDYAEQYRNLQDVRVMDP